MSFFQTITTGGLALTAFGTLSFVAVVVAALLLRDHFRISAHAAALEAENEGLQDTVWELRESEDRYRNLIEGQDDLILRRDQSGRLTYVNAAFVILANRSRDDLLDTTFQIPAIETSGDRRDPDGSRSYDQQIETVAARAGSPGWRPRSAAPMATPRSSPSAATSPTGAPPRPPWRRRAPRPRRRARRSRASSPPSATRSARRSTACSAWPTSCSARALDPEQTTYVGRSRRRARRCSRIIDEILDFSQDRGRQAGAGARALRPRAAVRASSSCSRRAPRARASRSPASSPPTCAAP